MVNEILILLIIVVVIVFLVIIGLAFRPFRPSSPFMIQSNPPDLDETGSVTSARRQRWGTQGNNSWKERFEKDLDDAALHHSKEANRLFRRYRAGWREQVEDNFKREVVQITNSYYHGASKKRPSSSRTRVHPKTGENTGGIRREDPPKRTRRRKNG